MGAVSVITIPLKTEKWQEDVLFKRFETCRSIYNAMLGYELKQYRKMTSSKEYKDALEIIHPYYKAEDPEEKKRIKKSEEYKNAVDTLRKLLLDYGFSSFDFVKTSISFSKYYKDVISSKVAQLSIGDPMWAAFDRLLFGNGDTVHFKKYDTFSSIVTDGKSGIRILGPDGRAVFNLNHREKYVLALTTRSQKGKNLFIPLNIDRKDKFMCEMIERDIHLVRITRKKVRGQYKYYVQLTVSDVPAIKYDDNGKELHPVKKGKLGLYIDTTSITIVSEDKIETINIRRKSTFDERIADIDRFLDESRRISNPENFNKDGTIKEGIVKNGQKMPLTWTYSENYKKAMDEKSDLRRKDKEQRKIDTNILANNIMAMGCDITVNDYTFQAAARRKKFSEGEELMEDGRPKRKKKAGKAINENAPAMIITTLDAKLKARGYAGVKKVKLKDIDYTMEDYRKIYAQQLYNM